MSKTISVKEAALRWGLTERRVTGLCRSGELPGAVKEGHHWKIPEDAKKPTDKRLKTGAYAQARRLPERLSERSAYTVSPLPLPVGISDYRLASRNYYYVDKTLLLKEFIDQRPMVTLFTRPRRFGKTLNMDMIRTYFERTPKDSSVYFTDKAIWACGDQYRAYQGRYPVIFISFKDVKHDNWAETLEHMKGLISDEYRRHSELLSRDTCDVIDEGDVKKANGLISALDPTERAFYEKITAGTPSRLDLERSLGLLTAMLQKRCQERVVVIIDEYDTPIQSGHTNDFYEEVISFMRNLLSGCFKDNRNLAFGFLTGILRVAKESIFSGLNNLVINSVLDNRYSRYFGFTRGEVEKMAAYYGASDKLEELCEWYDGYRFGQTEIFNPWSVINYFANDCQPRAFWLSTGSNEIIREMLAVADEEIYRRLTALVNGHSFSTYVDTSVIYPEIRKKPSSIYSFLLMAGYLKVVKSSLSISDDFICEVALPNREIALVYRKEILEKLDRFIPSSLAISVEEALFSGNGKQLQDAIEKLLLQSASFFDTANESFYHGLMLGICALFGNSYVTSNRESGEGRYDLALTPKSAALPGILIELKAGKNCSAEELKALALTALTQIKDRKYDTTMLSNEIKTIYRFGVAFCGKEVEVVRE